MRLSSKPLLKRAGEGISKTLSEILVCPISKQPLRKDELNASSPEDSLQSLGITSGDLAYFSVNPIAAFRFLFLSRNQDLFVRGHAGVQANDANSQETKSEISLDMLVQGQKGEQHEIGGSDTSDAVIERHGSLDSKAQGGETLETQELTSVEAMDIDTGSADVGGKRFSEPYFTRKLLRKEMGDDGYSYKFLDIAVHAVFIESGFGGSILYLGHKWMNFVFQKSKLLRIW
ncbi:hypothetical protein NC653_034338 [Populus alba x Populus x berolinensis]|uniref:Protein preY, mitochondrial n=1 Tax=Populus alba x Populus x berolinensis TaxID=444605 RepID=A0AAD6PXN4_9ROSI|nr:hypothetical protein NC653_034338 [Populus alba x Populus x berolinensis]